MSKMIIDDGFQSYLTEGAALVGEAGIPMLVEMHNTSIPRSLVPFDKCRKAEDKRQYVHFYMHDKGFASILKATRDYVGLLKEFDGIITPDCSLLAGQAKCLQETNTYFNRAVGVYLQKQGIPVIPNIRWSDEKSYEFCFLGVPKNAIVAISTHGCLRSRRMRELFKNGLGVMLDTLNPSDVIVHGYMPQDVFGDYTDIYQFHRFPSQFEQSHLKKEAG